MQKTSVTVFSIVALVALGGLVMLWAEDSNTGLVPADQPVNDVSIVKMCRLVDPRYNNCITPKGGCNPGYPEYKQYNFKVEGIPTCCCIPHLSDHKKRYGGSLYQ